ncbi:MAG: hypothetical protein WCR67_04185 [Bacilli bacterium]
MEKTISFTYNNSRYESTTYSTSDEGNKTTEVTTTIYFNPSDVSVSSWTNPENWSKTVTTTITYSSKTYTSPVALYDDQVTEHSISSDRAYHKDDSGFWGKYKASGSLTSIDKDTSYDYGTKISDTNSTSDSTEYGYKSFTSVYKQLTLDDYSTLGDLACGRKDGHGWYGYFAGFTTDETAAKENFGTSGTFTVPSCEIFDLNKALAKYDTDGDHNIYLYALYSNSKDYRYVSQPAVRFIDQTAAGQPYAFQWAFNRSDTRYDSTYPNGTPTLINDSLNPYTQDCSWYYTLSNVLVKNESSDTDNNFNTYYKNKKYNVQTDALIDWDGWGWSGAWAASQLDIGQLTNKLTSSNGSNLNNLLDDGCYYNFYVYFNERNGSSSKGNKDLLEANCFSKKNIVFTYDFTTDLNPNYCYTKLYIEKVYNYKITGDIVGSYDYSDSLTNFSLTSETATEAIYETNEVIFSSQSNTNFAVDFGSHYESSLLQIDSSAYYTSTKLSTSDLKNPYAVLNSDSSQQYQDPDGKYVYYQYDILSVKTAEEADIAENNSNHKLPIVTVKNTGVYKFRIKVTYSNGVPTSIYISAGRVKGFFLEVFESNPTEYYSEAAYSSFIKHTDLYQWRTDRFNNNTITLDGYIGDDGNKVTEAIFHNVDNTESKTLSEIIPSGAVLYDHVTKSLIQIDPTKGFSRDGGVTWSDRFTLDKNYIFFIKQ